MKQSKMRRLEAAGWKIGSPKELLQLSDEEEALIEMKLSLAASFKKLRLQRGITQGEVAKRLRSSQSRIAKLEAADATVSIDLLVRALLALGATRQQVGRMLGRKSGFTAA
jgi:ribosome-binding protein aMBF1 (putative translation factor)